MTNIVPFDLEKEQSDLIAFNNALYSGLPDDVPLIITIWTEILLEQQGPKHWMYHFSKDLLNRNCERMLDMKQYANIYAHPGLRKPGLTSNRRGGRDSVVGVVGAWVDIDIAGPGHAEMNLPKTLEEALDLVAEAFTDLSPTIVVHSGGGIHAYWLFKEAWIFKDDKEKSECEVLLKNWQKQLLRIGKENHEWKLDNVGSIDRAMRMPGTRNYKNRDNPVSAKILSLDDSLRYTRDDLAKAISSDVRVTHTKSGPVTHLAKSNRDRKSKTFNYLEADFDKILAAGCIFCQHIVNDADSLPEPHWFLGMSIIARCKNGEELAHKYSEPYHRYNQQETQAKYEQAREKNAPAKCVTIAMSTSGEFCRGCSQKGKISSPVVLGVQNKNKTKQSKWSSVEDLNQNFAVVPVNSKVLILREHEDPLSNELTVSFMSKADFELLLANAKILTFKNKELVSIPLSGYWLGSKERREYENIVFDPSQTVDSERYYNMYRGFSVVPKEGVWSKFKAHLFNVICGQNEEIMKYLLAWMARIVQDPGGKRPGVAIVIRGKEGTGKGTFMTYFGKIFGPHYLQITNQNQLTGRFNTCIQDKVLIFCDEGFFAGDKSAEGVLKGLITEDTNNIEPKGKDTFTVRNHVNLVIASNNDWVVPAGREARRFLVLEASDKFMQNTQYFQEIHQEMENGGVEAMMYDLLHMDISKVNLRNVPRTKALMEQIQLTMPVIYRYWFQRLQDGTLPEVVDNGRNSSVIEYECNMWHETIDKDILHQHYLSFNKEVHGRYPAEKSVFSRELRKICPDLGDGKSSTIQGGYRTPVFKVPVLDDCRKAFEQVVGMKIDWEPIFFACEWVDAKIKLDEPAYTVQGYLM